MLRDKLTAVIVGLSHDYQCLYTTTLRELQQLDRIQSPIDGLHTLQDALVNSLLI